MANEKRLIDANAFIKHFERAKEIAKVIPGELGNILRGLYDEVIEEIKRQPTVDSVEVVYCDECKSHGSCIPEETFRWMRIEKPYCCVGKRKTNTNFDAKMDGDGDA